MPRASSGWVPAGFAVVVFAVAHLWCSTASAQLDDLNALNKRVIELYGAGKYAEAVPLAERFAEATKTRYGSEAPQYATALSNLALLLQATNRLSEAELVMRRALAISEKSLGPDHPNVAIALNNLALLLKATNRLAEAEQLYRRSLAIDEKNLGPGHPNVAADLNNLAGLFQATNRLGEAEPLMRRVLAINEKSLGPDHPSVATALNNLALLLKTTNHLAEAEPLYRRALAIDKKSLGPDHPTVAVHLSNLAELLRSTNRLGEAEPLYRRALAIDEKSLGPDHPNVAIRLNNLALLLQVTNRLSEAEPLMRRALAIYEKGLGPDHPTVAIALSNLSQLLQATNRLSEAELLLRRALSIDEKSLGPDHPNVAIRLNNLALKLRATNRLSEAEALIRRALVIIEKSLGPNHPDAAIVLNNLAEVLRATNRLAEAEPFYRRALAIDEKSLGPDHPVVARDLNNLAKLLQDANRLSEAAPLMRRAIVIEEKSLGPNHPDVATVLNNLAVLFMEAGDWPGALAQFRRANNIVTRQGALLPEDRTGLAKQALTGNWLAFRYNVAALHHAAAGAPEAAAESFNVAQWALQTDAAEALRQMSTRFAAGQGALAGLVREQQDLLRDRKAADARLLAAVGAADARVAEMRRAGYSNIETRLDAIATRLRHEFPEYAAISDPQPLTIAATQALLRPDEALVQFLDVPSRVRQPEGTFIWVVTTADVRWLRIDLGPVALAARVAALRCGLDFDGAWIGTQCSDLLKVAYSQTDHDLGKLLPFDLARAHELYKALFGQIEDLIKDKQLLIVASGPLTQLPLQVLVTEPPKTALPDSVASYRDVAWLAREHAVTVLPSVSSLQALRKFAKASHANEAYIGFGNPLLDGDPKRFNDDAAKAKLAREKRCDPTSRPGVASLIGLRGGTGAVALGDGGLADVTELRQQMPLPETADELCDVAQSLGVDPAIHLHLGAKATEAEIKRLSDDGVLAKYRVVHFATHGALAGQVSGTSEPGLILTPPQTASETDDGYLTASEITGLKLDADWVILSACNTAAGGAQGAEALSGLARAFFYAGARSLLVSHWAVNSDATVKLITKAVSELKADAKIGRAEALRRSMLALITQGQSYEAHPAFWAPFALVGGGTR